MAVKGVNTLGSVLKPRVVVTTYKVFITRNNFDQYLKKKLKKNTGHLILEETKIQGKKK